MSQIHAVTVSWNLRVPVLPKVAGHQEAQSLKVVERQSRGASERLADRVAGSPGHCVSESLTCRVAESRHIWVSESQSSWPAGLQSRWNWEWCSCRSAEPGREVRKVFVTP